MKTSNTFKRYKLNLQYNLENVQHKNNTTKIVFGKCNQNEGVFLI